MQHHWVVAGRPGHSVAGSPSAEALTDAELLRRVEFLAARERSDTVTLIAHLAELDKRRLHLAQGCGSLFRYCTQVLRLAEHAALNRIVAAHVSRRFPAVLGLLAEGALNLSTLRVLAPHLRADSFESLVTRARGRSKREVEVLVAGLAPRPDVRGSIRRLPAPPASSVPSLPQSSPYSDAPCGAMSMGMMRPARPSVSQLAHHDSGLALGAGTAGPRESAGDPCIPVTHQSPRAVTTPESEVTHADARPAPRADDSPTTLGTTTKSREASRVEPLTPERYRVQFTVGAPTVKKLRQVQDLLRRELPDGDLGSIFERALTLLLEDVARRKLAAAANPRPAARGSGNASRHIPAHVRRAVWLRDGGRCAFVARNGRRCSERAFLEFHHREPYALGGEATIGNIALRCRAHNVYEAHLDFGPRAGSSNQEQEVAVVAT